MSNTNRLLESVHKVTSKLATATDAGDAFKIALDIAAEEIGTEGGTVYMHDAESRKLWFRHVKGGGLRYYGEAIDEDQGLAGQVFKSETPNIENNVASSKQHAKDTDEKFDYETRNLITVPLRYPGGTTTFGVMQLVNKKDGDFTDEDLTLLEIVASIAATHAENASLETQAQKTKVLENLTRIVYDINNKIGRINGPLEALRTAQSQALARLSGDDAASVREDLQNRVQALSEGIKDLQRYMEFMNAAVSGNPIAPRLNENDLTEVTERQLAILDADAKHQDVTLAREYDPASPLRFRFDSFLLERAVFNLVNNALKATPKGGTVTVRLAEEGDNAVLEVRDTGTGIPQYVLSRILQGNAIGTRGSGSGLSAKIVREVGEVHGGSMEGDSAEGKGTTFRLRIPMKQPF